MSFPRALLGVLLLAFGLRLAAVLWLSETVPFSDYRYYHMAAEKIVEDWGFFFDSSQVEYYGRFGWRAAEDHGLTVKWPVPPGVFQVLELAPGGLDELRGTVHYHPSFDAAT